jgi:hypothetical protein
MSIIRKEQLSNPLSASYAATASIATSASFATTASFALNAGGGSSTFPYTGSAIISGSLTITGSLFVSNSINSFNRLLGDSAGGFSIDWENKILYDVDGQSSVNYDSRDLTDNTGAVSLNWYGRSLYTPNQTEALNWDGDILNYSNTYLYRYYDIALQDSFLDTYQYSGEVINTNVSSSATQYNLVALSGSYWLPVNQTTDTSTKMLGIALTVNTVNKAGAVLLEGDISFDGTDGPNINPGLTQNDSGKPVYIRENGGDGDMSIVPPSSGYVRIVGHVYYNDGTGYIFKFKPSNDWYKLS